MTAVDFILPDGLHATGPPPVRDGVRLLVADAAGIRHARFSQLGKFLAPGDLSHLALLAAVAGDALVGRAYAEAVRLGYRWHEFGDSCLLLP